MDKGGGESECESETYREKIECEWKIAREEGVRVKDSERRGSESERVREKEKE